MKNWIKEMAYKSVVRQTSTGRRFLWLLMLVIPRWAAAEILPEDPAASDLRFGKDTIRYAKTVYLKDYVFGSEHWIDDRRFVASLSASKTFDTRADNTPKVIIVDTETGEVKDTGYAGQVQCYSEGRIATTNVGLRGPEAASYFGKLGEPLQKYPLDFPRDMELNKPSCQLVPRWKYPKHQPGEAQLIVRFPLKLEHGAVFMYRPKDFPVLQLGQDANKHAVFIRSGANEVPPLHVYLEQPSGKRIDISVNPGEQITDITYLPFENAYQLSIDLSNTQPIKTWEPRFVRLLYPDGTIKRYSVPKVIMDLLKTGKVGVGVGYSKLGMSWGVGFLSREPDPDHFAGLYIVRGNELVKTEPGGSTGPDGCKQYGVGALTANATKEKALREYYFINICKGE